MLTSNFQNMTAPEQLFRHLNQPQNTAHKPAVKQVEEKAEAEKPEWFLNIENVDVTTVSTQVEEVEAPRLLQIAGAKIDLSSKIESLKENYFKNYALTKSHNLMVARFAQFKAAALGALLSLLGVAHEELERLQKKAVRDAVKQNQILFEENEYNRELLNVIGGSKGKMRSRNRVLDEISGQLIVQAKNLGVEGQYTHEKILEIRLNQCRKILEKFLEEKTNLDYQYQMLVFGVN